MTETKALSARRELERAVDKTVWLFGGSVRDTVLGITPGDIDLYVQGLDFERLRDKCTVLRELPNCWRVRLRSGCVADVVSTDATVQDYLSTRDFTVNAMASDGLSLIGEAGTDFVEALLRTCQSPGDTFAADPIRIVRAYSQRLRLSNATGKEWDFAPELSDWLQFSARAHMLAEVDRAKLRNELTKLLNAGTAWQAFSEMQTMRPEIAEFLLDLGDKLKLTGEAQDKLNE